MNTLKVVLVFIASMWVAATVSPKIDQAINPCRIFPCNFGGPR